MRIENEVRRFGLPSPSSHDASRRRAGLSRSRFGDATDSCGDLGELAGEARVRGRARTNLQSAACRCRLVAGGRSLDTYALLDSGSEATLLRKDAVEKLALKVIAKPAASQRFKVATRRRKPRW